MPYPSGTYAKIDYNSTLRCKVPGCPRNRWRFSGYCQQHNRRNQLWGDPDGMCIKNADLTACFDTIERILDANPDHPGVKRAEEWFMRCMLQGNVNQPGQPKQAPVQPARHWKRMLQQNVSPHDCLITAASVHLLADACFPYKTGPVKSDRHAVYNIGHKVIRLSKFARGEQWITGKDRRVMGETIMKGVGPLLVSLARTASQMKQEKELKAIEFGAAFETPN